MKKVGSTFMHFFAGLVSFSILMNIGFYGTWALGMSKVVGVWLLDEGEGDIIKDSSGNNHDGKIINGEAQWVEGKFGKALDFPEGNVHVSIPSKDSLNLVTFSITTWVNLEYTGSAGQTIVAKLGTWQLRNYSLSMFVEYLQAEFTKPRGEYWEVHGDTKIHGDWHHVAATYDKSFMHIYVNGELDREMALTLTPDITETPLTIGAGVDGGVGVKGSIDEVGLFSVGLSADDVGYIMTNGLEKATLAVEPSGKLSVVWGNIKK